MTARAGRLTRLAGFAAGDFAFNLYWQSVMLYLLFYYTDALGLAIGTAAAIYVAGSVWDGVASFAVGVAVDRQGSDRRHHLALVLGAVPLGLAFVLAYLPPLGTGPLGIALLVGAHLAFRTAYALVNVPYLALSARISADSADRALVAGLRMVAGTTAAMTVALGTVPLGAWLGVGARAYLGAAILFAGLATAILLAVGATYRDGPLLPAAPPAGVRAALASLARNRAFTTLAGAMMAMIVAVTILNKSVLYYFKYSLGDQGAGELALGWMLASGVAAVPAWLLLSRRIGVRATWIAAVAAAVALLAWFAAVDIGRAGATQVFLVAVQVAVAGLNFALWAMLPDTIEWGQCTTGVRVEGVAYGAIALLQRIAIGAATAILGWSFTDAGYVANVTQSAGTLAEMRSIIALVPLGLFLVSGALMLANPLGRGEHARVLSRLNASAGH